jgi:hypothetical protein
MPSSPDEFVMLCEARDSTEAVLLRASLESRGIPTFVHGEFTHNVFGSFHGAAMRPRVFVPRKALLAALTLAAEIIPDLRPWLEELSSRAGDPFRPIPKPELDTLPYDSDDPDDPDEPDDSDDERDR